MLSALGGHRSTSPTCHDIVRTVTRHQLASICTATVLGEMDLLRCLILRLIGPINVCIWNRGICPAWGQIHCNNWKITLDTFSGLAMVVQRERGVVTLDTGTFFRGCVQRKIGSLTGV